MTKMEKVKNFVREHKNGFIIAGTTIVVVGCGIVYAIASKKSEVVEKVISEIPNWRAVEDEKIKALNWGVGTMTDLWDEGDHMHAIVNDVTVENLGKFGEELTKFEGVAKDDIISMFIGFANNVVPEVIEEG